LINKPEDLNFIAQSIKNNLKKVENDYPWSRIVDAYESLILNKR
jgi:hypothetical protein